MLVPWLISSLICIIVIILHIKKKYFTQCHFRWQKFIYYHYYNFIIFLVLSLIKYTLTTNKWFKMKIITSNGCIHWWSLNTMILFSLSALLCMHIIEIMPIFHNDKSNTITGYLYMLAIVNRLNASK